MKKIFVTLFALLAVGFASAQSEIIAKFNEGATALQGKNYTAAITAFETVIDKGTFTDPVQYPEGIEYVMINGELAVKNGKHTGTRNGVILRKKGTEVIK